MEILKFDYKSLKDINKTLVSVKEFNLEKDYWDVWEYNKICFQIEKYDQEEYGTIEIKRDEKGKVNKFFLYIGDTYNYFVVENDVVNIFKDLETKVYKNLTLKDYLEKDEYYVVSYFPSKNEFCPSLCEFQGNDINLSCFKNGNLFKTKKEAKDFINYIEKNNLNLVKELKKRKKLFKNIKFK